MSNEDGDLLHAVRRRLLGEVRLALGRARALMRDLRGEGLGNAPELERLAARADLLLAELAALDAGERSVPDANPVTFSHSSSSSSSSSGSSVA